MREFDVKLRLIVSDKLGQTLTGCCFPPDAATLAPTPLLTRQREKERQREREREAASTATTGGSQSISEQRESQSTHKRLD